MKIRVLGITVLLTAFICLVPAFGWAAGGAQDPTDEGDSRHTGQMYGKISPQPLTIRLSSDKLYVGESILMTVSGGVEPYIIIAYENKIQVAPQGKNTYQVTGLTAGASGVTIGDSKKNTVTQVIYVYDKT